MNTEQTVNSGSHGLKWGLIISVVYAILLFLRFYFGASSFLAFFGLTFVGYAVVLILTFICGYRLRRDNGGWIEMKEVFKSMFIAVLVYEFVYMLFTFVYLKYVDPTFFDKLRASTEDILQAVKQPQSDTNKILNNIDLMKDQAKNMGTFDFIRSYLTYVGITGLFALLFSFILKRKPPVLREDNFYQP
jgi:amino acid transporter